MFAEKSDMALQFINVSEQESIIELFGSIGEGWDSDNKNTATNLSAELARIKALKAGRITVKINSLGGDVNHALAIYEMLEEHPAEITTQIIGLCASAATIIAAAGAKRKMSRNALFLIHQCSSYLGRANQTQLAAEIESQQTVNKRILSIYTQKCGSDNSTDIETLFTANGGLGKWIEADEALRIGFITDIYNESKKAACIDKKSFINSALPELPQQYADFLAEETQTKPQNEKTDKFYQSFLKDLKNLIFNNNNTKNHPPMKNLFPLLCLAACLTDEAYNKEKGATLSDTHLQAIEKSLKEFSDLKTAFEAEKKANQTAQNSLAELQKQFDTVNGILSKLSGTTVKVEGKDPKTTTAQSFADWQKNDKYYQEISLVI
jgi:ATP-dependent protease ClpP protease subunit